jgi:hypothetical protein
MTAAIFNLNHPANTVHWHFFTMSVSNVVVIVLMLVVFALAVVVPFPGHASKDRAK